MSFIKAAGRILAKSYQPCCRSIHRNLFLDNKRTKCKMFLCFIGGFCLGQIYYHYLLKKIPFPYGTGCFLGLAISTLLGIGNAIAVQIRCISLLLFPMYCGKPGRGVLKAVVLTYVIAGPITNMGLNAKEVVRVFACSTQLFANLSRSKHDLMANPLQNALLGLQTEIEEAKDTFRSIHDVVAPLESEMEGSDELSALSQENDEIDSLFGSSRRSRIIYEKYRLNRNDLEKDIYQKKVMKKMEYRCDNLLSRAVSACWASLKGTFERCLATMPDRAAALLCWPLRLTRLCDLLLLVEGDCDVTKKIDPGLGEGYTYLKKSRDYLIKDLADVRLQYKVPSVEEVPNIRSAKETGLRVLVAFEEKTVLMIYANIFINICVALLFLRIVTAAVNYHDKYLTTIEFDNVYITSYFKKIDDRRKFKNKCSLLPLKKMERNRFIDVHSMQYIPAERQKLLTQILKVLLEMVTATTFVMLDRMFYEALDVVRQHAEMEDTQTATRDLEIKVEGLGLVAGVLRRVLGALGGRPRRRADKPCLPQPRLMPLRYFLYIYGGYLWIVLLLYFNAYTMRLRRLICRYFYPRREKQRILHLYNDILKNRLKMSKTLRQKAVQAVRSYYLSGENLLSLKNKFPQLLGWLSILPAARMTCLICGETEPRNMKCKDIEY